ncbi:MAG: hypothetical protein ACRD2C_04655 [Acidimicrobiales bacterium]
MLPTIKVLAERLPWPIRAAEWTDPTLLLTGDDWTLSITCSWRVVAPAGIAYGWSSADAEDQVWDLVGREIQRVEPQGSVAYTDPRLVLSGGLGLELFSETELDPWVLTVRSDLVIVGPLRRDDWT